MGQHSPKMPQHGPQDGPRLPCLCKVRSPFVPNQFGRRLRHRADLVGTACGQTSRSKRGATFVHLAYKQKRALCHKHATQERPAGCTSFATRFVAVAIAKPYMSHTHCSAGGPPTSSSCTLVCSAQYTRLVGSKAPCQMSFSWCNIGQNMPCSLGPNAC